VWEERLEEGRNFLRGDRAGLQARKARALGPPSPHPNCPGPSGQQSRCTIVTGALQPHRASSPRFVVESEVLAGLRLVLVVPTRAKPGAGGIMPAVSQVILGAPVRRLPLAV
jgi:hypothetical protein